MEKFTTLTSRAAPFPLKNIDTDMIIPAQYLTSVSKAGYAEHLFERLRAHDPNFFMHQSSYKGARILVVGENFGCGSSREHAVWALMGAGFRVIIGSGFADIFSGNAAKNGLLLIVLPVADVNDLLAAAEAGELTLAVDLEKQKLTAPNGKTYAFDYDPFRKSCLLSGHDDIDYLLSHHEAVKAHFAKKDPVRL